MKTRWLAALLSIFLAPVCFAQVIVNPAAGVATIDASKASSFKVPVSAAITNVNISNGSPGQQIAIIFVENATGGFAVAFGSSGPSTIAGTCTVTTTANASTTCTANYDITSNTWTLNTGGGGGASFSTGYIDPTLPANGGVKANGGVIFDATLTLNSNIVTSASAKFITGQLPAVVGMRAVGTCCGHLGALNKVNSTVLIGASSTCLIQSVDSDTQVHVTTGCNSSANQSNALFAWIPDETNAWKTTISNAWGNAGHCKPIFVPGGLTGISDAMGNTTTCKNEITNNATNGAFIGSFGGRTGGYFVILPEFVANAMTGGHCTGGGDGIGCLFSSQGIEIDNLGFWGLENSPVGATCHSFAMLDGAIDTRWYNILLAGFLAGDGDAQSPPCGFVALGGNSNYGIYIIEDGMGNPGAKIINGGNQYIVDSFFGDNDDRGFWCTGAGAILQSNSTGYGPVTATNFVGLQAAGGCTLQLVNDRFPCYNTSPNIHLQVDTGSFANLVNVQVCPNGANNASDIALKVRDAGSKVTSLGSTFNGGASGNSVLKTADTSIYWDQGGNIYGGGAPSGIFPTCAMTTGGGTGPACVIANSDGNDSFDVQMTPGTTPGTSGTTTVTYAGTWVTNGSTLPALSCMLKNGTGTWNARATLILSTDSTTAPVITWDNNGSALTAASTYFFKCTSRPH